MVAARRPSFDMRAAARAKPKLPLEYNLLLTATLACSRWAR